MLCASPCLHGYNIPGITQKLIISLYADNTTVFLSRDNSYEDLQTILDSWCIASGTKFNTKKTEVIPTSTKTHRLRVIASRRVNPTNPPLHPNIKIAPDGYAVRSLGAWIGNETKDVTPWELVLDKVHFTLQNWNKGHPTLFTKHHIIQMFTEGMTQFLTKAQGMPKHVEDVLTKIIHEFIWDSSTPPPPTISIKKLYAPKEHGGINLLNIPARNKVIEITWLKAYLDLSPAHPNWAFVTDAIINHIRPDVDGTTDLPIFSLTTWSPPTHGHIANSLPPCILKLIKMAKLTNLAFAPLKLSKSLKLQLPAWYHLGAPPRTYNKARNDCLKCTHKAMKIKNLIKLCKRLCPTNHNHQQWSNCNCSCCLRDRTNGCKDPHSCASTVEAILLKINQKFNPAGPTNTDNLTLTHHRIEKNAQANIARGDEITFNPSITTRTNLSDCFRIFANLPQDPSPALRPPQNPQPNPPLIIYMDGSCLHNSQQNATSGAGIWVAEDHPLNRAIQVPGDTQSNQTGELAAVVVTLQSAPPSSTLKIITDSQYMIQSLTSTLESSENTGWANTPNTPWLKAATYHLRRRSAPTQFKWIKGHEGTAGNKEADKLAATGTQKSTCDVINLTIPQNFNPTGIKASTVSQASAYTYITSLDIASPS